jgi:hypothetical protein
MAFERRSGRTSRGGGCLAWLSIAGCVAPWGHPTKETNQTHDVTTVSVCELMADPARYNHKLIKVTGTIDPGSRFVERRRMFTLRRCGLARIWWQKGLGDEDNRYWGTVRCQHGGDYENLSAIQKRLVSIRQAASRSTPLATSAAVFAKPNCVRMRFIARVPEPKTMTSP